MKTLLITVVSSARAVVLTGYCRLCAQVVDEFETLSKLAATLKKQAEHGSIFAPAATKKPRAAAKR